MDLLWEKYSGEETSPLGAGGIAHGSHVRIMRVITAATTENAKLSNVALKLTPGLLQVANAR